MPRIERLKQNTPEWHRWRLEGIGASDAPVVMGDAPFRTRRFLWSVKTGLARESGGGPAARRGRALEHTARGATSDIPKSRWSLYVWSTTAWNGCEPRWTV